MELLCHNSHSDLTLCSGRADLLTTLRPLEEVTGLEDILKEQWRGCACAVGLFSKLRGTKGTTLRGEDGGDVRKDGRRAVPRYQWSGCGQDRPACFLV